MDFKRSLAGLRPNCALGPRVHINTITSTVDGNTIYGSAKNVADQLRTFSGGLLKVQNSFDSLNLKPLLPKQVIKPDLDCFERPQNVYCFLAGDDRVNEQPTLTVMHTIWVREHNRMASQLEKLNPHWDDDRIYHETRHIVAAKIQNILVSEYLPLLVGKEMMAAYNLTRTPRGSYWQGYNPDVTPSISQGFSAAAFRQGHTFIQGKVRLHDSQSHNFIDSILLRRLFKRPFHYYQPNRVDQVLAGIVNTPAQSYDPFITEEIGGHLFEEPGMAYGMDLPAINLARGREQGVPGYNLYREWCGLSRAKSFEQLVPYLANQTAFKYSTLFKHVDDIDLWSGGVSEYPVQGGLVGPTFACMIARQFANIKRGDRFWYENEGFPSQFTMKQLDEIKKSTLARVLCKNSDNMRTIQRQALRLSHPILNPRMACRDIPDVDLKYWREDPNNLGSFLA